MAVHILLFPLLLILAPDLLPTHREPHPGGGGSLQAWAQRTTDDQESFRAVELQDGSTCMKVETFSKLRRLDEILDALLKISSSPSDVTAVAPSGSQDTEELIIHLTTSLLNNQTNRLVQMLAEQDSDLRVYLQAIPTNINLTYEYLQRLTAEHEQEFGDAQDDIRRLLLDGITRLARESKAEINDVIVACGNKTQMLYALYQDQLAEQKRMKQLLYRGLQNQTEYSQEIKALQHLQFNQMLRIQEAYMSQMRKHEVTSQNASTEIRMQTEYLESVYRNDTSYIIENCQQGREEYLKKHQLRELLEQLRPNETFRESFLEEQQIQTEKLRQIMQQQSNYSDRLVTIVQEQNRCYNDQIGKILMSHEDILRSWNNSTNQMRVLELQQQHQNQSNVLHQQIVETLQLSLTKQHIMNQQLLQNQTREQQAIMKELIKMQLDNQTNKIQQQRCERLEEFHTMLITQLENNRSQKENHIFGQLLQMFDNQTNYLEATLSQMQRHLINVTNLTSSKFVEDLKQRQNQTAESQSETLAWRFVKMDQSQKDLFHLVELRINSTSESQQNVFIQELQEHENRSSNLLLALSQQLQEIKQTNLTQELQKIQHELDQVRQYSGYIKEHLLNFSVQLREMRQEKQNQLREQSVDLNEQLRQQNLNIHEQLNRTSQQLQIVLLVQLEEMLQQLQQQDIQQHETYYAQVNLTRDIQRGILEQQDRKAEDLQWNLQQQHENQTSTIQQVFTDIQQIQADALLQMQNEMRRILTETVQSQVEKLANQLLNQTEIVMETLVESQLNPVVQQHHQLSLQLQQLQENFTDYVRVSENDEWGSCPCRNGATCRTSTTGYRCICISGYVGEHCHIGAQMRLINNSVESLTEGRLEVFYSGQWGTVCDDSFDNKAATMACRSLNSRYTSGIMIAIGTVGTGRDPIWLDDVTCTGGETHLINCRHLGWGSHNCAHSEDVAIRCS